jgi:orotidine-5'-phosphate decarboxylase
MNVNPGALANTHHFGDAVIERARSLGHCFCLGLDPHLALIPAAFHRGDMKPASPATIGAIEDFLGAVIDQTQDRVIAYKPQSAMYERLGSPGIALLERIVARAHARGRLVLLDAKRGDIESTAEAYAQAYLAPGSPNPVDALTVNPYMGLDTIEPYLKRGREAGKGVFVLLRTSNPGAGAFQDLAVDATTVCGTIASALRPLTEAFCGGSTGWSSLGVVVGTTFPEEAVRIRALLPRSLFLLPGFGYQKGDVRRIAAALVPGPRQLEGGLISSSRATLFPDAAATGSFRQWKSAFLEQFNCQLEDIAESLSNCAPAAA